MLGKSLVLLGCLSLGLNAWAFDPVTIAAGAQTVSTIMGGLEKADELAGLGFSLHDLFNELGVESPSSARLDRALGDLEKVSHLVGEARWMDQEMRSVVQNDLKSSMDLKRRIDGVRRTIEISKRLAGLMGVRSKAAEKGLKVQEIKIQSMILDEIQELRREEFLRHLEAKRRDREKWIFLAEIEAQERGKSR